MADGLSPMAKAFDRLMRRSRERAGHVFERKEKRVCDVHGEYAAEVWRSGGPGGPEIPWPCPKCSSEAQRQELVASNAALAAERRAAELSKRLDAALIPERFARKGFDDYRVNSAGQKRVLDVSRAYAEGFAEVRACGRSMIFSGGWGTGKTHLSTAICSSVIAQGYSAVFTTVSSAVRRVRAAWKTPGESERAALALFASPDLLVLDEVGVQSGTENEFQILFDILNARYARCAPTILLTNLPILDVKEGEVVTVRGLESFIGRQTLDRLREGGGRAYTFDWESARASV